MLKGSQTLEDAQTTALNVDCILNNNIFVMKRNPRSNYCNNKEFKPTASWNYSTPMGLGNLRSISDKADNQEVHDMHKFNNSFKTLSTEKIMKLKGQNRCSKCQKVGHIVQESPNKKGKLKRPVVYNLLPNKIKRKKTGATEGNLMKCLSEDQSIIQENNQLLSPKSELLRYDCLIAGFKAKILIDCGASNNFMNRSFADKHNIKMNSISRNDDLV